MNVVSEKVKMIPSKYQQDIYDAILYSDKNVAVSAGPGCLHPSTSILMYDGSIKIAKDIKIGDILMGPDSTKRTVLKTDFGMDDMYKIIPKKGESWVCNSKHVLTVHDKKIARSIRIYKNTSHKSPLKDINIKSLIGRNKNIIDGEKTDYFSQFTLQRVGVSFKEKITVLDPYLMGLWLGDGAINAPRITTKDKVIIDYSKGLNIHGITVKITPDNNCFTINLTGENFSKKKNIVREEIKKAVINNEKRVPKNYLINSYNKRLSLLAGLIDSDGTLKSNVFSITTKYNGLKDDILYLCRSLGLAAYASYVKKGIKNLNFEAWYWSITISGDLSNIPTLLKRKRATKRKQIKSVLRTQFKIEKLQFSYWCGFTVDKDNRFLLGDFTITHNSGKTTTIIEASKLIDPKKEILFAAFGKSIVKELSSRLPNHVLCSTLHSIGMSALMSHFRVKFTLNEFKTFPFIEEVLKTKPLPEGMDPEKDKKNIQRIHMKYRFSMRDALDLVRMTMTPLDEESLFQMCVYYDIDLLKTEMLDVITIMKKLDIYNRSLNKKHNYLDYTDMIFLPVTNPRIKIPQFDIVFLDECQDMNLAQQSFIERLLKPKGRLVSVGDKKQAIYSFAGADIHSFERFSQRQNTLTLPLSICYRCGTKMVELAQQVYSDVEPCPTNGPGEIRFGTPDEIESGDMVLSRNNKPLVLLYFKLLTDEKNPVLIGSDIQNGLEALVSKVIKKDVEEGVEILYDRLMDVANELKERGVKKIKEHPKYESLNDKIKTIEIIGRRFDKMKEVYTAIGEMFKEKDNCIKLLTIHRAKGSECDRVFYIERFEGKRMLPSPYAVKDWEIVQENNLKFVMLTRAKKSLIFIRNLDNV